MKIILLQDEKKLGKKGDIIEASEGYARNYILPKKIGVEATSKNMNDLKLQKANEEKVAQENLDAAKALAAELETKQVMVKIKAGEGGKTFGSTMIGFREKYFRDKNANMPRDKYFPKWVPLDGAKEELGRKMKDTSVRVAIDDCMDLPPVVQKTIAVEMDPEQRRIYQDMLREFVAVFERGGEQKESVATMAMTKGLRLMQIASGYVKDAEGQEHSATANDWTPKQEALKQILEDWTPGHKVIVWAVWKHNYEQIREVCRRLKIEWLEMNGEQGAAKNRENAKTFEASEQYRVIIGHPESGGEGINLVSSPCRVSYSRNFSWRQMKQSDARNRRGGSERHASITRINLVTKGTVEEKIMAMQQRKSNLLSGIFQSNSEGEGVFSSDDLEALFEPLS